MDPSDRQGGKKYGQMKARQEAYLESVNRDILSDEDFEYVHVPSLAERLQIYKKKFMKFDEDNSGDIDFLEVKQMLEKLGVARTHLEAKKLIQDNDKSKRGAIGYRDFVDMLLGNVLGIGMMFDEEEDLPPTTVKKGGRGMVKQKRQAPEPPKSSTPFTSLPKQHSFQEELKNVLAKKIPNKDKTKRESSSRVVPVSVHRPRREEIRRSDPTSGIASVYRPPTPDDITVSQTQESRLNTDEYTTTISSYERPITPVGFPEPTPPSTPPPSTPPADSNPPPYEPPTHAPSQRHPTSSLPSPEVVTTAHHPGFHHPSIDSHGTARVYGQNPTVAYPCTYACCAGAPSGVNHQAHGVPHQMYAQKCAVPGCTQCVQGIHQMSAYPSPVQPMFTSTQPVMGMVQPGQTVPQGYIIPHSVPYQTVPVMNLNGSAIPSGAVVYPSNYGHHAACPCPSCAKAREMGAAGGMAYAAQPQYVMTNGAAGAGQQVSNGMAFQGSAAAQSRNGFDLGHGYKLYSGSNVEEQMAALNLR